MSDNPSDSDLYIYKHMHAYLYFLCVSEHIYLNIRMHTCEGVHTGENICVLAKGSLLGFVKRYMHSIK